jgi:hypothetical protein
MNDPMMSSSSNSNSNSNSNTGGGGGGGYGTKDVEHPSEDCYDPTPSDDIALLDAAMQSVELMADLDIFDHATDEETKRLLRMSTTSTTASVEDNDDDHMAVAVAAAVAAAEADPSKILLKRKQDHHSFLSDDDDNEDDDVPLIVEDEVSANENVNDNNINHNHDDDANEFVDVFDGDDIDDDDEEINEILASTQLWVENGDILSMNNNDDAITNPSLRYVSIGTNDTPETVTSPKFVMPLDDTSDNAIISNIPCTGRPPSLLYLSCDYTTFTEYQVLVRKQIELFETTPFDLGVDNDETMVLLTSSKNTIGFAQGRNKPVRLGQIGIRCIHCRFCPLPTKTKGAVYYPAKTTGIYQAAQNMASIHLLNTCHMIPVSIREELQRSLHENSTESGKVKKSGGGKHLWAHRVKHFGVYEDEELGILRYHPPSWFNDSEFQHLHEHHVHKK